MDGCNPPIGIPDWLDTLLWDQPGGNLDDAMIQLIIDLGVHDGALFLKFAQDPFPVLLASLSTAALKHINGEGLCNMQIFGTYLSQWSLLQEDGSFDHEGFNWNHYYTYCHSCRQVRLSFMTAFRSEVVDHHEQAEAAQAFHSQVFHHSGPPSVIMTPSVVTPMGAPTLDPPQAPVIFTLASSMVDVTTSAGLSMAFDAMLTPHAPAIPSRSGVPTASSALAFLTGGDLCSQDGS